MKVLGILVLSLFAFTGAIAQDPVKWSASYKAGAAGEGEIVIIANIEKGWHTYSQKPVTDGPIPTSFTFTPAKGIELSGATSESESHVEYVKAFEAKLSTFSDKAEFRQKVKVKNAGTVTIKVEYMCCNDMMCLPPKTVDLTVKTR